MSTRESQRIVTVESLALPGVKMKPRYDGR
jgi:hypothetical protein